MYNKMKNYNQSNPFVISCIKKHDELEKLFLSNSKHIVVASLVSAIMAIASVIYLCINFSPEKRYTVYIAMAHIIAMVVEIVIFSQTLVQDRSNDQIKEIMDADFSEINVMNNETLFNTISLIDRNIGKCIQYNHMVKVISMVFIVLFIASMII